jgi:drug/metabolite transporter (DMT)-like permease
MTTRQIGALGFSSSTLGFALWNHAASSAETGRAALFLYFLLLVLVVAGATLLNERYCCSIVLGGSEAAFAIAEVNVCCVLPFASTKISAFSSQRRKCLLRG